ncbi:Synaptophysin [Trichinella patagoniensis]|uniref:Synaptophysin n=1 Tax=Trichinella patagoniensis TaxID=990121 RepID=A0A0V1AG36_9BILA|nr:Synaptophysin [Trichinella patagoniensis]
MAEMQMSTRILKEPLGFIRILEFPMVLLAFATTAGYSATLDVKYKCTGIDNVFSFSWFYPFDLTNTAVSNDLCKQEGGSISIFGEGAVSQSQFFVCTGVLSFLYIIGVLYVYLFQLEKYESDHRWPLLASSPSCCSSTTDFVVTAVLAVFWFIASCAWASGVNVIKGLTDFSMIKNMFVNSVNPCKDKESCHFTPHWNYAALNVSLIAGFACFFLFASNLWFIWKETEWFKSRQTPNVASGQTAGGYPAAADVLPR